MRALIIDDEAPARAALRGLLRAHPAILPSGEADTLDQAAKRLAEGGYDLVFLDIQLRGGTGFDLVPFVQPGARIIFVTAFDAYAARAFEVNALDYLLKPVRPERLAEALRRIAGVPARPEPRTPLPTLEPDDVAHLKIDNGTARFVALRDIAAVEADENYTLVCLADGARLLVRRTLKTWEQTLPASHFVRVHRGTIVNLARYRRSDRESESTTLLHLEGLRQPVTASYRYLAELRTRLLALGRQL
jgi:two-component system LytT family response regulator